MHWQRLAGSEDGRISDNTGRRERRKEEGSRDRSPGAHGGSRLNGVSSSFITPRLVHAVMHTDSELLPPGLQRGPE